MFIGAIKSLSIYEYYYSLNSRAVSLEREEKEKKITPSSSKTEKTANSDEARSTNNASASSEKTENYQNRPWADIMYQLNISFNKDPKDDITSIKNKLMELYKGIDDEELKNELEDLKHSVESSYSSYVNSQSVDGNAMISNHLNNMSIINKSSLLM